MAHKNSRERSNLDLREEAVVAAIPKEQIDGVVRTVVGISVSSGGATHRRHPAGVVREAVAHSEKDSTRLDPCNSGWKTELSSTSSSASQLHPPRLC